MSEIVNTLLVDQAYHKIKEDVLHKRLIPGYKINVREISERYNISVTPIKQALNRLVSEGIVESIPHRGMIVKELSQKDLIDSLEARRMIELYCVPSILHCAKIEPSFIQKLKSNIKEFEQSIKEAYEIDNYFKQNMLDFEFHKILVSSTQNEYICNLYESVGTHMTIFYLYGSKNEERFEKSLQEHQNILNSIESRDESLLIKAIITHINNVQDNYYAMLKGIKK